MSSQKLLDVGILGAAQCEWLKRELTHSNATWKIIAADMPLSVVSCDAVAQGDGADICFTDPGFSIDLNVDAEARAMAEVWIGKLELGAAMRSRRVRVSGPEHLVRSMPDWLGLSSFAYPDPAAVLAERG